MRVKNTLQPQHNSKSVKATVQQGVALSPRSGNRDTSTSENIKRQSSVAAGKAPSDFPLIRFLVLVFSSVSRFPI